MKSSANHLNIFKHLTSYKTLASFQALCDLQALAASMHSSLLPLQDFMMLHISLGFPPRAMLGTGGFQVSRAT